VNTHDHIDELAELYALGSLDEAERASVDEHARSCAQCAARVGEAERFIAQTIEQREPSPQLHRRMHAAFVPRRSPAFAWAGLAAAIAAAFVLGLLLQPPPAFQADRDRALVAMINSHFVHAQFTPLAPDAPKAKVIYGRRAPWRLFIAQTTHAYAVRANSGAILGELHVSGDAAELFVPRSAERSFVLLDGSRPVAKVTLR
jgi:hypothetical protein